MKKTVLVDEHIKLGAKMVEFAGWYMPIQYLGLKEEHLNVRKNVGIFDVSHMGEIRVKGSGALETLQWLTTNDVSVLKTGEAQYNLLPNDQGGLVDDIIVYCFNYGTDYLLCVNASNKDKDFQWLKDHVPSSFKNGGVEIVDESNNWSQIAVQGPLASSLCKEVMGITIENMKNFQWVSGKFQDHLIYVATTGYTGEKGCEIFIENAGATALWNAFLSKDNKEKYSVMPIGLAARDTLRLEMKYPLYGHEINDTSNPYGAQLGWVIKPQSKDFIGKKKMVEEKEQGLENILIGFKLKDKGIPRQDYHLMDGGGKEIGRVTSGTMSPSLDEAIGIGYVKKDFKKEGSEIFVDIRGRRVKAIVCKTPFVHA